MDKVEHEGAFALADRIKTTLTYPLFVSFFGVIVLILLLMFVVPSITSIFADMHQTLPLPTRLLSSISGVLKAYWWLFGFGLAGLARCAGYARYLRQAGLTP